MVKTFAATVTSKGQMTIPVEVRRYLDLKESDKVIVSITEDGVVQLSKPRYPDLKSLRGAAGKLDRPLPWDEVIRIAREDALLTDSDDASE